MRRMSSFHSILLLREFNYMRVHHILLKLLCLIHNCHFYTYMLKLPGFSVKCHFEKAIPSIFTSMDLYPTLGSIFVNKQNTNSLKQMQFFFQEKILEKMDIDKFLNPFHLLFLFKLCLLSLQQLLKK